MKLNRWLALLASTLFIEGSNSFGAAPDSKPGQTNPVPVQVTNALAAFSVKEGFRIEIVADQAMVASPAAMAFDENGRLFVAEMRDYPDRREQTPHLGRVRLLEDTNSDGIFDRSRVFADNLAWPSGIACANGGVFVGATPEVLFFKDTSGSGVADIRKVVFHGFGSKKEVRADALLNGFAWGPDNRIHVGAAGMGGTVVSVDVANPAPVELGLNDFAFDPVSMAAIAEPGSAQSGVCFDDFGRRFFSELSRPLRAVMYDPRYIARNPFFVRAPEIVEVMNPVPIFRYLFQEAAGDSTAVRLATPAATPAGFGALTTGWMTMARGCAIYRGSLFPGEYFGNVFIAEPKAGVIHRAVLRTTGLDTVALRAPNEPGSEFLISKDPLFHPSDIVNGPDGALYVADMREGGEQGRIYRIAPSNFRGTRFPAVGQAKTYDLAALLAQTNGWLRDTASRLIHERHDPATVPLLITMANNARAPAARLQALRSLAGLQALNEPVVLHGLRDPDEHVREEAVRLSEGLVKGGVLSDVVRAQLKSLAGDSSARVRYQLAFTLGQLDRADRPAALVQLAKRDGTNPWMETAIFSSLSHGAGECFATLAADPGFRNDPNGAEFLRRLMTLIGVQGQFEETAAPIDFIDRVALVQRPVLETRTAFSFLAALGEGLHRNRSGLALVDQQGRLRRFFDQALSGAADDTLPAPVRVESIRLLGVGPYTYADVGDLLLLQFGSGQPAIVQSAAIRSLGMLDDARISTNLFSRMQYMTPGLRREAVAAVLGKSGGAASVLGALETRQIGPTDLSSIQVNFLRTHKDPAVSEHAVRLFGAYVQQRPGVLEQGRSAAQMAGAAARGRPTFTARCALCHRLGAEGKVIGPDLGGAKARGREKLVTEILAPNLAFSPQYTAYVAETGTLESLVGVLADEGQVTVTIAQPDGAKSVWPRAALQALEPQRWSIMPDGMELGLNAPALADLVEFLMTTPR